MSKFNSPVTMRTTNQEGHAAYRMTNKAKLVTQVLTSFFNESKFYGDNSKDMQDLIPKVIKEDPEFVSKLAVFARREFNMRSVSHVLTAYLAHEVAGKPFVRETVKGISLRGDDITELMAFYLNTFGKPIPNSLKKGIGDVLKTLDEYSLAKYKGTSKDVKMRDLLCLCRPKPQTPEQEALWKRVLEDTLAVPETWETELSKNGNTKESWEKLIASHKVGYMALLRNLRNILKAEPSNIEEVFNYIRNPEAVRKSKQLPFRFLSAYQNIQEVGSSRVYDILEDAMDASIENLPKIPGRTVIAIDSSGSMDSKVSEHSDMRCSQIALLLGLIANRICKDAIVYRFDTKIAKLNASHRSGILQTVAEAESWGGGTAMELPFQAMINDKIKANRVIVLSDNMCNSTWHRYNPVQTIADGYRRKTGNDIWVHAVDLQGYGTQQFAGPKTNIIAGWSEKIFNFILLAEQGEETLEKTIAAYQW